MSSSAALVLAALTSVAPGAPVIVEPMDRPTLAAEEGFAAIAGVPWLSRLAAWRGLSREHAPSHQATMLTAPPLQEGKAARTWLALAPAGAAGFDGVNFWIKGNRTPVHVQILLRSRGTDGVFASRVLLVNPFWHRVYLPLSEFYDRSSRGTYPIRRLGPPSDAALEIGVEVEGPQSGTTTFVIDEVGLTTRGEVVRTLGWRTFMPPGHGFPTYLERHDGAMAWSSRGGAVHQAVPLEGFPHEGFEDGLRVVLPDAGASVERRVERLEELHYYEGFGFWVRGDGQSHTLEVRLANAGGAPFLFQTPVRGAAWKYVFCGFENFKRNRVEPFEVEDAEALVLSFALATEPAQGAAFVFGPMRYGYEQ